MIAAQEKIRYFLKRFETSETLSEKTMRYCDLHSLPLTYGHSLSLSPRGKP